MLKHPIALIAIISLSNVSISERSLATERVCSATFACNSSIDSTQFDRQNGSVRLKSIDSEKSESPIFMAQSDTQTQLIRVDNFRTYRHKNSLFSVSMPSSWEKTDTSKPDEVIVSWIDKTGNGVVSIDIFDNLGDAKIQNSPESLGIFLSQTINNIYGKSLKNVVIGEPNDLGNGVVRLSWTYESEVGGQTIPMNGTSFIRLNRDRISIFTDIIPTEQFERLKPALDKIVQSFKVNSTIPIPKPIPKP
jgi:hypothetical protein